MSVTKKIIIDDIILRVTDFHPTDDFDIPRAHISYILDTVRDRFVSDTTIKDLRNGGFPNSIYIVKDSGLTVTPEGDGTSTDCALRHYVTMTRDPIWAPDDGAIVAVTFADGTKVDRVSQDDMDFIKHLTGSSPSSSAPVFHREGRRIYIDEISSIQANDLTVNVHYVPTIGYETDETVTYELDDSLRINVTDTVADILIEQMGGIIDDDIEDGNSDNE